MKKVSFTLSFLFILSGMLHAQQPVTGTAKADGNQFFLLPGYGYSNQISPSGRYVTGVSITHGYLYDVESQTLTNLSADTEPSEASDVNSDGIVAGVFSDPDLTVTTYNGIQSLRVAGVWQDGWTSLGIGSLDISKLKDPAEGSEANAISSDGKTVVGCLNTNAKVTPCAWTKGANGTWTYNEYAYPSTDEKAQGAKILTLSGDGTVAGGWVVVNFGGSRRPIIWRSPTDYQLLTTDLSIMGVSAISDNGKYAGFAIENRAALYYVDEDRHEIIPGHQGARSVEITGISDNGLVIGYSSFSDSFGSWRYGFVYSEEMGFVDLSEFIDIFAPDLRLPPDVQFHEKFFTVPMDISADGKVITGWHGAGVSDRMSWVLKLAETPQQSLKQPRNLRAFITPERHVRLSWEAPETSEAALTGYRIYLDGQPLDVPIAADVLEYEDNSLHTSGVHTYNVSAVYTQGESFKSNDAYAIIADNNAIPFLEDFDTGSLETNHWYADGWLINQYVSRGIYGYGVTSASSASTSASRVLTSKNLDATQLESVYLNFVMGYAIESADLGKETLSVEVLYDDSGWKSVWQYVPTIVFNPWAHETVDLTEHVAGKFFQIRFCSYGENPNSTIVWDLDNIRIDGVQTREATSAPSALIGTLADNKADITWKTPEGTYELTYLKNNEVAVIGNEGRRFIAAVSFGSTELSVYRGKYLSSVSAMINQNYPAKELEIGLVVFRNGEKIVNQPIRSFVSDKGAWNTFALETPLLIDGDINDLKIGIDVIKHAPEELPIGTDVSQWPTEDGNLYSEDDGKTWRRLTDDGYYNNLAITGNLTDAATTDIIPEKSEELLGYFIYRDDRNQGFTPLTRYTDNDSSDDICYKVSAYYKDGLATLPSEPFCMKGLSVGSNLMERVHIYPNPVSDFIRISGDFTKASLLDISGKKILETTQSPVPVSQLANGIYLLVIESGTQVTTSKIVKK
jgi:hypothetical protein